MKTAFNVGVMPFYYSEEELRTQLILSGKKCMTVIAPNYLGFFTLYRGNLEGWFFALIDLMPSVPFPYLWADMNTGSSILDWEVYNNTYNPAISNRDLNVKMVRARIESRLSSSSPCLLSVHTGKFVRGSEVLGGIKYPDLGNISVYRDGVPSIKDADVSDIGGAISFMQIMWGSNPSESNKFSNFNGPCTILWHDEGMPVPRRVIGTGGLLNEGNVTFPNIAVVSIAAGSVRTVLTTVSPVMKFNSIGTLTPRQLDEIVGKPECEWQVKFTTVFQKDLCLNGYGMFDSSLGGEYNWGKLEAKLYTHREPFV